MLKAAIEKIIEVSGPKIVTDNAGAMYSVSNGGIEQIRPELDYVEPISLNSLDALVQMVKSEATLFEGSRIYLSVRDHLTVSCFGHPRNDLRQKRIVYYEAQAKDVPGWDSQTKLPFDQAAVALQTRFQESADRTYTLTLLSQITTGAKITYNDIGVATTVVTSKGVSLQQNSTIRPLVKLRPYRTFPGGGAAGGAVPDPHRRARDHLYGGGRRHVEARSAADDQVVSERSAEGRDREGSCNGDDVTDMPRRGRPPGRKGGCNVHLRQLPERV